MTDPRVALVGAGYDAMTDDWEAFAASFADDARMEWLRELTGRLPEGADVLELGCGGGTVETRELASRYRLTGVDLSEEQLRRARARVPGATFVRGDMTTIELAPESFDAVAAFYSFVHVPRELLGGLFARIASWLRPGGLFLAALGAGDIGGWQGEWLGVPMFFSSYTPSENVRLLRDAGFRVEREQAVLLREPTGDVPFHWVLVRR